MSEEISLLEKELAKHPIVLPKSPFWEVFKRFGRDEAIAMVINVLGTGVVDYFIRSDLTNILAGPASRRTRDLIVTATGPVIEKAGFFPAHFKEALDVYRTTTKDERDPLTTYFKRAVKGGSKSLIEDIVVHDPLYIGLMYAGLNIYPETPAWMLSTISFLIAVFGVAGLEVGITELMYHRHKKALKKIGFGTEPYLESRFLVSVEKAPEEAMEALTIEFGLNQGEKWRYHDRYFENNLPLYSGRIPKLRLRERRQDNEKFIRTAQIIYSKPNEISKKRELEQYRYFPIKKDKIYFMLEQEMPWIIDDIKDERVRRVLNRATTSKKYTDIEFERIYSHDSELLVSVDQVLGERPFYVVELKTYSDKKLLKKAMRFIMHEFPVVQTTHGKLELTALHNSV